MMLSDFIDQMLPAIETELQQVVQRAHDPGLERFYHMLAYHLGWESEIASPQARGKRIRPLLVLLTTKAAGRSWEVALPAAAAVELVHNFSLIHDDIEDGSQLRRGRKTVWTLWGVPQAINTGDAMFSLAHLAIFRLEGTTSQETALKSAHILQETCLQLTKGQHLDMTYEKIEQISEDDYWLMVRGKTAALLSACTELGALCAGAARGACQSYRDFGLELGMAFQAHDDLLGIWGDAALTGKSNESDLITGKKSLPILYGINLNGPFARRWNQGAIQPDEIQGLAHQLEDEGALRYTQAITAQLTKKALDSLSAAQPSVEAGTALADLATQLINRKG